MKSTSVVDFVLSPTPSPDSRFIFCRKKKWPKFSKFNKRLFLKFFIARDYLKALQQLGKSGQSLHVMILDDQNLLAAVAEIKPQLPPGTVLSFYYHGHSLSLGHGLQQKIDQVLFLTKLGYSETLRISERFLPKVRIVGNGVDSEVFFPLSKEEKLEKRRAYGFSADDLLITWMANSRPVKGLHLFSQLIPSLLDTHPSVKIQIIGSRQSIPTNDRVIQTGLVQAREVSQLLQISDYYFFTSLWKEGFGLSVVEAAKCGNYLLASRNGGIPDVLEGYPRVKLIENPNILGDWISAFESSLEEEAGQKSVKPDHFDFGNFHGIDAWEKRFSEAFE